MAYAGRPEDTMAIFDSLKSLFGGGAPAEEGPAAEIEHKGFIIRATPYKENGQYQTCGVIAKEVDGVMKEHRFIRADRYAGREDAVTFSLDKGKQIVDQQGERVFKD
jgi:hypothetical protein